MLDQDHPAKRPRLQYPKWPSDDRAECFRFYRGLIEAQPRHERPAGIDYNGLLETPSDCASTARFERFRNSVLNRLDEKPDDPYWLSWLQHLDRLLAWRAALAPELRFWWTDA